MNKLIISFLIALLVSTIVSHKRTESEYSHSGACRRMKGKAESFIKEPI